MTFPYRHSHKKQTNRQTNKNQIKPNELSGKAKIVWVKISACLIPHAALLFREWKCFIVDASNCIQAEPDYVRLDCGAVIHVGKHFLSSYNDLSQCPPTWTRSSQFHLSVSILIEWILGWASLYTWIYKQKQLNAWKWVKYASLDTGYCQG